MDLKDPKKKLNVKAKGTGVACDERCGCPSPCPGGVLQGTRRTPTATGGVRAATTAAVTHVHAARPMKLQGQLLALARRFASVEMVVLAVFVQQLDEFVFQFCF
ncbi:Plant EC metallothionein-like protein, family 15 [Corchorus olitorius]|uniref:Plant EC metallothionein-like protein, family 15 n=1 Tax=Corchorus olitorius TaxID=93759 RepID=A0A1R3GM64_9ROSI|nr:Plant EC metallothionein-like protein, family 15 [Corchorus olitorius]